MLALTLKERVGLSIGNDIVLIITAIKPEEISVSIHAPRDQAIVRTVQLTKAQMDARIQKLNSLAKANP